MQAKRAEIEMDRLGQSFELGKGRGPEDEQGRNAAGTGAGKEIEQRR